MCYSFNDKANRDAFVADEAAYCARYGLNAEQRQAVAERDVLKLLAAGGNAYYLAKFAGIFGLDMFAGAGLSQAVWNQLDTLAERTIGARIPVVTGLGMTEASPSCTFAVRPGEVASGHIGLPVPGVEAKLVPDGTGPYPKKEIRFRGPNVMPGYWREPKLTMPNRFRNADPESPFDLSGLAVVARPSDALAQYLGPSPLSGCSCRASQRLAICLVLKRAQQDTDRTAKKLHCHGSQARIERARPRQLKRLRTLPSLRRFPQSRALIKMSAFEKQGAGL